MTEREFDDLLREALVAAAAGRYESAADSEMIVTAPYQRRFAKMLRDPYGYAGRYGRIGRYAMTAVITLAVLGATIFAIPQTRAIAINILTQWHEKYVSFIFSNNALPQELPEITIGYIPEGYELDFENYNEDMGHKLFVYKDSAGNILDISIYSAYRDIKFDLDNEHREILNLTLDDGSEALYLKAVDDGWPSNLLWRSKDNKLVLCIGGNLSDEELLKIAAGIKI